MPGTLFILSDFGGKDCYVAQMKAAVLSFAGREATMIDLTHSVRPGAVGEGAFHLMASLPFLPDRSVILAVVDPGVGTGRRGVACRVSESVLVGPDNGLFSWVDADEFRLLPGPGPDASSTFHGRDWFAPAAARFMVNPGWFSFLEPCPDPVILPRGETVLSGGTLSTTVAHTDRFGNCVLWAPVDQTKDFSPKHLRIRGRRLAVAGSTAYLPEAGGLLFLRSSQGFMELAVPGGSAEALLGLSSGDQVQLEEE